MTEILPDGHPLSWDELVGYEKDQGGYWLYPAGRDMYGNDKIWVRVPNPAHAAIQPGELDRYRNEVRALAQRIATRAGETGNQKMAALAAELEKSADHAASDGA